MLAIVACLCYREYNAIAAGYGFGAPGIVGYGAGLLLLVWWDVPAGCSLVGLAHGGADPGRCAIEDLAHAAAARRAAGDWQ